VGNACRGCHGHTVCVARRISTPFPSAHPSIELTNLLAGHGVKVQYSHRGGDGRGVTAAAVQRPIDGNARADGRATAAAASTASTTPATAAASGAAAGIGVWHGGDGGSVVPQQRALQVLLGVERHAVLGRNLRQQLDFRRRVRDGHLHDQRQRAGGGGTCADSRDGGHQQPQRRGRAGRVAFALTVKLALMRGLTWSPFMPAAKNSGPNLCRSCSRTSCKRVLRLPSLAANHPRPSCCCH